MTASPGGGWVFHIAPQLPPRLPWRGPAEPLRPLGAQLANGSIGPPLWGPVESLVFCQDEGSDESSR